MAPRPYVLLSVAASIDGCIDDTNPRRLLLSNEADFDRVDAERAKVDAILVGAGTVRADDPRLLVRSAQRRHRRAAAGKPASPVKVTVTASGDIDPDARFFTTGDGDKLVYTTTSALARATDRLGSVATVLCAGEAVTWTVVLADLAARGIGRLMVEGGASVATALLSAGLFDELHMAVAPFLIGDADAPRFAGPAAYTNTPDRPLRLAEVRGIGEVVLLRYLAA